MADLSRRSLLRNTPAVAFATVALPTAALVGAASTSEIRKLFDEWKTASLAFNASELPDEHPERLALFDAITKIEDELFEYVPQSVEDFALLVLVVHEAADPGEGVGVVAMVKMAHEIAGIPLPAFRCRRD